ncbi:hypothetical protein HH212_00040 [Massilia forsythiae]|uniref:Uncharacterized protein n=1 Tax=Massilia forsythiae TaxID=2728020 RepID=A0A7Z2VSH5_9BURK|nr:hypothetical protein [Massilia forsythiae]QJD98627.1 hypothetical protein HH212_00040 [Massilia forsythiae]
MDQGKKPTAAERNEKVRAVLLAAGEPLEPVEIAERIGEDWCRWNGMGMGSAVTPALRQIGAKNIKGKWALKAPQGEDAGPIGSFDPIPHQVMRRDRWEGRHAATVQQK